VSVSIDVTARRGSFELRVQAALAPGATGVLGANGSGKTTLLHVLAGLVPAEGRVVVGDTVFQDEATVLPPEARRVGLVFQDLKLFPHLTVRRNLAYGARVPLGEILDLLGLHDLLERRPHELSGGQQQRVALGRALATEPRLLLLDEALSNLDAAARREVIPWLRRALERTGVPTLVVSHVLAELLQLCDRLLVLDQGRVVGHGRPTELWADPAALGVVLHDLGLDNVIEVRRASEDRGSVIAHAGSVRLVLPRAADPEARRVAVRPEEVLLAVGHPGRTSARNVLAGRVTGLTEVAGRRVARIDVGFPLVAEVTRAAVEELGLAAGTEVHCLVKASAFRWL
jgi:molybdate transport system ATP-binding protein